ncbi:MAG: prephenate dehydrogenase [Desulfonauticus sp.]|jgi:prephenate dehydrogenase|nr:prephenate dehydrogenase [Desulfonauticus sp.]
MEKERKKVVILGARGKMGKLFTQRAQRFYPVKEFDLPLEKKLLAREVKEAFLVLLCVPIKALDEVLEALAPCLQPPTILADICSVKVIPLQKMHKAYAGPVVGTHPLFGPDLKAGFSKIALCAEAREQESVSRVAKFFQQLGFETFFTTPREHDLAMAYIQGLNFISTLTYFASLEQNLSLDKFMTPSFKRRQEAAAKMLQEDFELFTTLFEQNPYSSTVVRTFKNYLNLAAAGELEVLAQRSWWWWQEKNKGEGP